MKPDRTDEYYRFYALRDDPPPCHDWWKAGMLALIFGRLADNRMRGIAP